MRYRRPLSCHNAPAESVDRTVEGFVIRRLVHHLPTGIPFLPLVYRGFGRVNLISFYR